MRSTRISPEPATSDTRSPTARSGELVTQSSTTRMVNPVGLMSPIEDELNWPPKPPQSGM